MLLCRLMKKTMIYLGILVVGFIAVSIFSFWITTHPPTISFSKTPSDFDMSAEDVSFQAVDGTPLNAWLIPSDQSPKRALILLHGYPASRAHMLPLARHLSSDFTLFIPDMRSFGESGGYFTTLGVKERGDLSSAIDLLKDRGYDEIGVHGFSLGGAVALMTAAEDDRIDAVSSLSSFADLRSLGHQTYSHLSVLKYPLVALMNVWGTVLFGDSLTANSPVRAAEKIRVPVLLAHGREDNQIPFSHAKQLQAALSEQDIQIETLFFEGGSHGRQPPQFDQVLRTFFQKHLQNGT